MWTETTRPKYERSGLRYVSDLTDAEWKVIGSLLPARKRLGRPRTTEMREVVNPILYMARTGCQWRLLGAVHRIISRRKAAPISMSAFGGKADVNRSPPLGPLRVRTGRAALTLIRSGWGLKADL